MHVTTTDIGELCVEAVDLHDEPRVDIETRPPEYSSKPRARMQGAIHSQRWYVQIPEPLRVVMVSMTDEFMQHDISSR